MINNKEPMSTKYNNTSLNLPEILESTNIAKSKFFTIESVHLKFSNGEQRHFERMKGSGRGAVMIVPFIDDDTLLLIREYAAGTHRYELGFPKGLIESDEDVYTAANRELQEEVGYGAEYWHTLKKVSLAPGYFNATMTLVIAKNLYEKQLVGDEPERLQVVPWSITKIDDLMQQPDFTESRSISALLLAKRWIDQNARTSF